MRIAIAHPHRLVLMSAAVLALSVIACSGMPAAANATGPIPCKLDSDGNGCSDGDPWVANLFYMESYSGYVYTYTRSDGKAVTDSTADTLAKNLGFRECYPVARSGPSAKRAICLD